MSIKDQLGKQVKHHLLELTFISAIELKLGKFIYPQRLKPDKISKYEFKKIKYAK